MSDLIISARNLTKTYRLYSKPHHRLLDVMGLLRGGGKYSEHHALYGINLEIQRGEKVALIGRNGAGKSTLLKLITGVTQPSAGELIVRSEASALLQIGTTFHPEFTGRQNVLSYLAHLGIAGSDAEIKLVNIIEFAELEEYIDQPVKTYSTGMSARLMFATSTIMQPELLVIDEILSVGDAYFSQKSFERIKEMCAQLRTTLLLVTHDIYSASTLCERMIWIDRGEIMIDGPSIQVMKAYEDSIRKQEESRLREKKRLSLVKPQQGLDNVYQVEIVSVGETPPPCCIGIEALYLVRSESLSKIEFNLGELAFDNGREAHLVREGSCWGDMYYKDKVTVGRTMKNYGSPFHKVSAVFTGDVPPGSILGLKYTADEAVNLGIRCYKNGSLFLSENLPESDKGTVTYEFSMNDCKHAPEKSSIVIQNDGVFGSGNLVVKDLYFVDRTDSVTHHLDHGKECRLRIHYSIPDPDFDEQIQIVVAFHTLGGTNICRFFCDGVKIFNNKRHGTIDFYVPTLILSNGKYSVTLLIAKEGYYDRLQTKYFSLNPEVYYCLSKGLEVEVIGGDQISWGTFFVGAAKCHLV
jgi:ABC-type polysaccharide/polyol phosphate transport system ATPase subunit